MHRDYLQLALQKLETETKYLQDDLRTKQIDEMMRRQAKKCLKTTDSNLRYDDSRHHSHAIRIITYVFCFLVKTRTSFGVSLFYFSVRVSHPTILAISCQNVLYMHESYRFLKGHSGPIG